MKWHAFHLTSLKFSYISTSHMGLIIPVISVRTINVLAYNGILENSVILTCLLQQRSS